MNRALDANCYLAALSIALTLPDICGKAAFPAETKVSRRYINWFDEHIGVYEKNLSGGKSDDEIPYLSGEVVYQLRNSVLHQGTPNVEKDAIKKSQNKIDNFQLVIEQKNKFDIYSDSAGIINNKYREYRVNVRRLCLIVSKTAACYYNDNKEKFNFFNFSILDWDEVNEKMKKLDH